MRALYLVLKNDPPKLNPENEWCGSPSFPPDFVDPRHPPNPSPFHLPSSTPFFLLPPTPPRSQSFHDLLGQCLVKDYEKRPTAAQLLSHAMFANVNVKRDRQALAELVAKLQGKPVPPKPVDDDEDVVVRDANHPEMKNSLQSVSSSSGFVGAGGQSRPASQRITPAGSVHSRPVPSSSDSREALASSGSGSANMGLASAAFVRIPSRRGYFQEVGRVVGRSVDDYCCGVYITKKNGRRSQYILKPLRSLYHFSTQLQSTRSQRSVRPVIEPTSKLDAIMDPAQREELPDPTLVAIKKNPAATEEDASVWDLESVRNTLLFLPLSTGPLLHYATSAFHRFPQSPTLLHRHRDG